MTSFVSRDLLTEEPCYKFMLKYDNPKLLSTIHENFKLLFSVKYNTRRNGHVKLYLTYIVKYPCQTWNCSRSESLFYWMKIVKYIKMFKIRSTKCYDINITCI